MAFGLCAARIHVAPSLFALPFLQRPGPHQPPITARQQAAPAPDQPQRSSMARKAPPDLEEKVKAALGQLALADPSKPKESYAFWGTQPVAQFGESSGEAAVSCPGRSGH